MRVHDRLNCSRFTPCVCQDVEFGGNGNVRYLAGTIEAAACEILSEMISHPWYFPSVADFASLLERYGLEVTQAALIDRPTALEGEARIGVGSNV